MYQSINKIIKLYLIWSVIYLPLALYNYYSADINFLKAFLNYIRGLFLVGEHWHSWILWYLLSALYALLFYYRLAKWNFSIRWMLCCGIIIYLIGSSLSTLTTFQGELPFYLILLKKFIKYTLGSGRLSTAFLFLPLGEYVCKAKWNMTSGMILTVTGFTGALVFPGLFMSYIWTALLAVGIFTIILNVTISFGNGCIRLRKMSSVIYFIHLWIWTVISWEIYHADTTYGWQIFFLTAVISSLLAYILTYQPVWEEVKRLI